MISTKRTSQAGARFVFFSNIGAAAEAKQIDGIAFRWREMLESGDYSTIREIAAAEKINESYLGRVLRLTLLAPEIVKTIMNGQQPSGLQLDKLMRRFPVDWQAQKICLSMHIPNGDIGSA